MRKVFEPTPFLLTHLHVVRVLDVLPQFPEIPRPPQMVLAPLPKVGVLLLPRRVQLVQSRLVLAAGSLAATTSPKKEDNRKYSASLIFFLLIITSLRNYFDLMALGKKEKNIFKFDSFVEKIDLFNFLPESAYLASGSWNSESSMSSFLTILLTLSVSFGRLIRTLSARSKRLWTEWTFPRCSKNTGDGENTMFFYFLIKTCVTFFSIHCYICLQSGFE